MNSSYILSACKNVHTPPVVGSNPEKQSYVGGKNCCGLPKCFTKQQ